MPYIVTILVEALLEGLAWLFRTQLGRWVLSLMLFFGINFATSHLVVQPFLDQLKDMATSVGGGGGEVGEAALKWLGILNFDRGITMICSAVATKYSVTAGKVFLQRKAS